MISGGVEWGVGGGGNVSLYSDIFLEVISET